MPKRQQLLNDLAGEQDYGVLLLAQMGGVPNELQLLVQTAEYDAAIEGLRERRRYIIRALGVYEHQLSLGVFGRLALLDEHPLLYAHNTPKTAVFFRGTPSKLYELTLDLSQAHASTFGPWRLLADDLNHAAPLVDLLASGGGLLGEMPRPAAERMARVFEHHGMEARLIDDPDYAEQDEHGRSRRAQLLLIDEGYVIALGFSVDEP